MTRKLAADRHAASAPASSDWPPTGAVLVDVVKALAHPARRRLFELLVSEGSCNVSQLADRTGLAPGSVSHHMATLHRAGLVAPMAAADGRSSWWAATHDAVPLDAAQLAAGTVGHSVVKAAQRALLADDDQAARAWLDHDDDDRAWASAALLQSLTVWVTPEQAADLARRLSQTIEQWHDELPAPSAEDRSAVRVVARVFPHLEP